jgi:hypothetical protein
MQTRNRNRSPIDACHDRRGAGPRRGFGRILNRAALLTTVVLTILCTHTGPSARAVTRSRERIKHVVIISIESLRWDHLGLGGYSRPTSPMIDALAVRGTSFARAYAQAPWTRPSIASTFTSTYPSTHRAADDSRFGEVIEDDRNPPELIRNKKTATLSSSFDTLAEVFSAPRLSLLWMELESADLGGIGVCPGF